MFFVLSDSSLVGIYLGVVREDCEIDLHIFQPIEAGKYPEYPEFHLQKIWPNF